MSQFPSQVLKEQMLEREKRNKQKMRLMNSHPYDVQAQRLIAEEIRQKNVEANMEAAMEYNPETFGSVVMLYINCKVRVIDLCGVALLPAKLKSNRMPSLTSQFRSSKILLQFILNSHLCQTFSTQ